MIVGGIGRPVPTISGDCKAMTARPSDAEYAPHFSRYVALVPEPDALWVLHTQIGEITRLASAVPLEHESFRYAPDKWTIREVFGHLVDCERVFGYRAFCIGRGEQAPLPAFDENTYVAESRYNDSRLNDLVEEFTLTRNANLKCFGHLTDIEWKRQGTASSKPISVRALAFIMAGHVRHHINGLQEHYGVMGGKAL